MLGYAAKTCKSALLRLGYTPLLILGQKGILVSKNVRYALIIFAFIIVWLFSGLFVAEGEAGGELNGQTNGSVNERAGEQVTTAADNDLTLVEVVDSRALDYQSQASFNARTEPFRIVSLRAETDGPIVATDIAEGSFVPADTEVGTIGTENRMLRVLESRAQLDQVQLEYKGALELRAKSLLSEAEVAREKFAVDSAKASLESAQLELARVRIMAPFDGILNERFFEMGDYLQRGQEFAEFLQLDPIKAVFSVSASEVVSLDPQAPIKLRLSDGRELVGEFLFRSVMADTQSRAFKVEAVFDNPDNLILADLTGVVTVAEKSTLAHSVPASLLSLSTDGSLVVKTVDLDSDQGEGLAQGRVTSYPVRILTDNTDSVWITGLPDRATVIVRGYEYVGIGQRVRVSHRPVEGSSQAPLDSYSVN